MKRSHLLLLLALASHLLQAQPNEVDETISTFGVKSVSEYKIVNGEKQLIRKAVYDREGRNISRKTINRYDRKSHVVTDTFIIHSEHSYTRIAIEKNRLYDSITWVRKQGPSLDTIMEDTYDKGKIILHCTYIGDDRPELAIYDEPGPKHKATFHTYDYEFNNTRRGQISAQHERIYNDNGAIRTLQNGYGFYAAYDSQFVIREHYTIQNNERVPTFVTYSDYEGRFDSSAHFQATGEIDYTYVFNRDHRAWDSVSVQRDANGHITNRNVTTYGKGFEKTEHFDSTGSLWKTREEFFNDDGMTISVVETYIKTDVMQSMYKPGDVERTVFEYEYY